MRYRLDRDRGNQWRTFQIKHHRSGGKRRFFKGLLKYSGLSVVLLLVCYQVTGGDGIPPAKPRPHAALEGADNGRNSQTISTPDVQELLADTRIVNLEHQSIDLKHHGRQYHVITSLDVSLQGYLKRHLKRSTSRFIGIVVMDPKTGRILSMIGYDRLDSTGNPCLDNRFPAASIFKIITAAAAIETHGFSADSKFRYNGRKHTLYRSQLKDRKNRYTRTISLQDSFAQSINPVFGKIGVHDLGPSLLEKYAESFGFNRKIQFELPLTESKVSISDKPYHWAEIASGFNRDTTLSPIHGALMATVVTNRGRLIKPTVIDRIIDDRGRTVYRGKTETLNQVVSPESSDVLHQLMEATIRSGTSRKTFRGYQRDRVLSKLNIGGKTGSIGSNESHNTRFDWFVGFAEEKDGPEKLVVSVVVAHEKYIGIRASKYARMAIKHYFRNYFLKQVAASDKNPKES